MSQKVKFQHGKSLNNRINFNAGTVYFDIENKQIWYDSPFDNNNQHILMANIGEVFQEEGALPPEGKQNDIVIVKQSLSNTYNIYMYHDNDWVLLTRNLSSDKIIYTGPNTNYLKPNDTVTTALKNLEIGLTTKINNLEDISERQIEAEITNTIYMKTVSIKFQDFFNSYIEFLDNGESFNKSYHTGISSRFFISNGTTVKIGGSSVNPSTYITGLDTYAIEINIPTVTSDIEIFINTYDYDD